MVNLFYYLSINHLFRVFDQNTYFNNAMLENDRYYKIDNDILFFTYGNNVYKLFDIINKDNPNLEEEWSKIEYVSTFESYIRESKLNILLK
jgi:hypothetical protein